MLSEKILVKISPETEYNIFIDSDLIKNLGEKIYEHTKANKILLVISKKVYKLYKKELNFKNAHVFIIADGEKEKNLENYQKICDFASKIKLERKDAIVAIGGGVVGDLAGFAAATYLRGIDFIQIPTTLLACVDSSVGGKVGINTKYGKNLIGAFYQPKAVFCNLNFLKTLDERQFKTGLAEIIKYALIEKSCEYVEDFALFDFLNTNYEKILTRNISLLAEIIKISLLLKVSVVLKDEKELGLRKILNFGHTLGHAIERITNYKTYTHGEAVAIGMKFAVVLAYKNNMIENDYKIKAIELIDNFQIVKNFPTFNQDKLVELMYLDKKVENKKLNFVLPTQKAIVAISNKASDCEIKLTIKSMN